VDTCFLIDWAKYRRRDILQGIFEAAYVTRDVLDEARTEATLSYIGDLLADGFLAFYPLMEDVTSLVREIVAVSIRDPRIRTIDPPEAFALAIAVKEECICLTENKGVLRLSELYRDRFNVEVWRSYEVLKRAYKIGLIESLEEEIRAYEEDTGHLFPRRRVEKGG